MKIYSVTFNQYTNALHDCISKGSVDDIKYLNIGNDPFLITEDQIMDIQKYGNGIKSLNYVGELYVQDKIKHRAIVKSLESHINSSEEVVDAIKEVFGVCKTCINLGVECSNCDKFKNWGLDTDRLVEILDDVMNVISYISLDIIPDSECKLMDSVRYFLKYNDYYYDTKEAIISLGGNCQTCIHESVFTEGEPCGPCYDNNTNPSWSFSKKGFMDTMIAKITKKD